MYNEVFDQIGNSQPKLKIWLIKEGEENGFFGKIFV